MDNAESENAGVSVGRILLGREIIIMASSSSGCSVLLKLPLINGPVVGAAGGCSMKLKVIPEPNILGHCCLHYLVFEDDVFLPD